MYYIHIAFEIDFKLLYRICTEGKTENHKRKSLFKFKCEKTKNVLFISLEKKVEFDKFEISHDSLLLLLFSIINDEIFFSFEYFGILKCYHMTFDLSIGSTETKN